MDDLVKEIHSDVKLIRAQLIDLIKQGAVHNQILAEHEKRSTALETRIKPIEETYHFMGKFSGALGLLSIIMGIGSTLYSFLKK